MQMRSFVCISLYTAVLLSSCIMKAAEPSEAIDRLLAKKVIIYNNSQYPIEVKTSDPKYSFRIASKTYQTIGNLSAADVALQGKLHFIEFGHSGQWQGLGQTKGRLHLIEQIKKDQAAHLDKPDYVFVVIILDPSIHPLTRMHDWTKSARAHFAIPSQAIGKFELPKSGDPYDIQDFKGVKDVISQKYGAATPSVGKTIGVYESIHAFQQADYDRWARLVLGLPQRYSKELATEKYNILSAKYSIDNFPAATQQEKELLNKVQKILEQAKIQAASNPTSKE